MRTFTRWSNRNPLLAATLGALACALILYAAARWDQADRAQLYWSVAAQTRGRT